MQIFGGSKETLVEAAQFVAENTNTDIIDINMGCPVPKVTKTDAGARWLLDPDKVYEMVKAVSSAVEKPVTVKMRTGWDGDPSHWGYHNLVWDRDISNFPFHGSISPHKIILYFVCR